LCWLPKKQAYKIKWALLRLAQVSIMNLDSSVDAIISCIPEETIKQMTISRVDYKEIEES